MYLQTWRLQIQARCSGPAFWQEALIPNLNLSPTFKSVFEQDTDVVEKKQNKKNEGSRHASQAQRV